MKQTLRLRAGIAAVALATAAGTALAATPAQAVAPSDAQTSAGRLGTYLADHDDHFTASYVDENGETQTYPDYGLTLDGVLALDAAKVGNDQADQALDYVAGNLASYIGDGEGEKYAGATAKALLATEAQRPDAEGNLGGVDLVQRLTSLENSVGRFRDISAYGNYSNIFGQSIAMIALPRAGVEVSKNAKRFLRAQQCPNGGFRSSISSVACTSSASAEADATAIAMQALLANPNAANQAALVKAGDYLKTKQVSTGGVRGKNGTAEVTNTNTTALAVVAMRAAGRTGFADRGLAYLGTVRLGCDAPAALTGLVAYNAAGKTAALGRPSDTTPTDQELRSTTQAVLGLSGVTYIAVSGDGAGTDLPVPACP